MKEMMRLIFVLTLTAALTGALLALANMMTEEPIGQARRGKLLAALNEVLPSHDNAPDHEIIEIDDSERVWTFYPARHAGAYVGAAFTSDAEGYGGVITVMVGLDGDDHIHAIRILNQIETPGLGANIAQPAFMDRFSGLPADQTKRVALRQEGGDIDAVTAATISSRAVTEAVAAGLRVYEQNRTRIRGGE